MSALGSPTGSSRRGARTLAGIMIAPVGRATVA